jgi:sporulation integral membrane protein YtvI
MNTDVLKRKKGYVLIRRETAEILLRAIIVAITILALYWGLIWIFPFIYPFFIGWLIAMIAEPAVQFLERRLRLPRWLGVTLSLLVLVGSFLTLLIFLTSQIVVELTNLAEYLPSTIDKVNQYIVQLLTQDNPEISLMIHHIQDYMKNNPEQKTEIINSIRDNVGVITNKGTQLITDIISGIGTFLRDLPYYATVLVFIILAAFFIGVDWPLIKKRFTHILPKRIQTTGGLVIRDLKRALLGFIRAQLTLISITTLVVWVGLMILGVDYALTLVIIIGIVDLLPYLGVGAVLVPWSLYLLLTGQVQLGVSIGILYLVLIVIRQLLEPKLVATNIGLNPLVTLIALFIGLKLFGFFGLILGPVVVVILMALYRANVFVDTWKYIKGETIGGRG